MTNVSGLARMSVDLGAGAANSIALQAAAHRGRLTWISALMYLSRQIRSTSIAGNGSGRIRPGGEQMTGIRRSLVAAAFAVVLGISVSPAAGGTSSSAGTVIAGTAGASTAACLAHIPGGLSEDWYDSYRPGCTGHDEPELDPVSSASRSAQNITWRVQLPADGTFPVSSVGPTFWFGGTV